MITISLYLLTNGMTNLHEQFMGIAWEFLILYDLSAYGQDLRDDLNAAVAFIRYRLNYQSNKLNNGKSDCKG